LAFKLAKDRARELRNNSTDSEKLLWERLRNRKLGGYKFLRQHPVIYRSFTNRSEDKHIVTPLYEVERGGGESSRKKMI